MFAIKQFDALLRDGHANYRTRAQYQRILATRRSGQRTRALQLFASFIKANPNSTLLDEVMMEYGWTLRDAGEFAKARTVYVDVVEKFPKSAQASEALWLSAWCDIRTGQTARAVAACNRLIEQYPGTDYEGRGYFWLGKLHERLGHWENAETAYRRVVELDTYYYVTRAEDRLVALEQEKKIKRGTMNGVRKTIADSSVSLASLQKMPFPRVELLKQVNDYGAAIAEMESLIDRYPDQKAMLYYHLIDANQHIGQTYRAYIMAYRFSRLPSVRSNGATPPQEIGQLLYPIPFRDQLEKAAAEFNVDPHYVAAMIREESRFQADVVSLAGAYGLMQVMPTTGETIAKKIGIPKFNKQMLFDPEVNMRMGSWYIRYLADMFEQDFYLVSGAYNAGEGRMGSWKRRFEITDPDEFIENVPFDETRNHIKKVMDSYHAYRHLYGEPEPIPSDPLQG